ncbi:hypothetical protein Taro_022849 [Colocasia esculenta]|uniref:Uncharacterized protein n=1 Tax=Colocasia esculenta TaxID=4460 RepID=A0A843V2N4_COLES|nr:hypothetical protein [Colocasia esculenta]
MASPLRRVAGAAAPSPAKAKSLVALRYVATESAPPPVRRHHHHPPFECPHDYAKPSAFLRSWKSPPPTTDPAEAQKKLALLRREYEKQVKQLRRQYAYEMELQRQERLRKDEARREAARVANEERKEAKVAAAEVAAAERKVFEEDFRQTLLKERVEKLESWRSKVELQEKKRGEKTELLHRQSSMWIDDNELDKRITVRPSLTLHNPLAMNVFSLLPTAFNVFHTDFIIHSFVTV